MTVLDDNRSGPVVSAASLSAATRKVPRSVFRPVSAASLSADGRIRDIDDRRSATGLSHMQMCQRAGISEDTWLRLRRGDHPPRPSTLRKLRAALRAKSDQANTRAAVHGQFIELVATAFVGVLAIVCAIKRKNFLNINRLLARPGEQTADPLWRKASDLRAVAMYLLSIACNVPQAVIARAVGLTPAAVSLALTKIEARRDDARFDAELARIEQIIRGV
jgi:transcriptional regulator with XRE-family HTH domain